MQINNTNLLEAFWNIEKKLITGNASVRLAYDMVLITKLRENINNFNRVKELVRIYRSDLENLGFNTDDIFISKLSIK